MQILVKILQGRKKAGGAIQGGRGLADGIAGREDERPLPERLAAPGTVPCRVPFLAFLIHQRSAPHSAGGGQSWRSWPGVWATLRSTRRLRGGAAPRPPVRARGHSAIPRHAKSYGHLDNERLMMHYGFDILPALVDGVGFLGRAIGDNDVTMAALKRGKMMTFNAMDVGKVETPGWWWRTWRPRSTLTGWPAHGRVHDSATRVHRLVAAGQPLEVPGRRSAAGQAGAAPRLDLPQPSTRTHGEAP